MKYTRDISIFTHEVKQSKFIAHFMPYFLYEKQLQLLQKEHPKARHFVTAFRYLNEYQQIVEHSSDDGEPKGTSGKPSLMVLQGQDIINSAVIIVRYFGGTKLGTGGLVRAYSDAVNLVLEESDFYEYIQEIEKEISIHYSEMRLLEYTCKEMEIQIVNKTFDMKVVYILRATEEKIQNVMQSFMM